MTPAIIDNFLSDPHGVVAELSRRRFDPVTYEGVSYPYICLDVPRSVRADIQHKLGPGHNLDMLFARKMPLGHNSPHKIHSDITMGDLTLLIYLNQGRGDYGTAFYKHIRAGDGPDGLPVDYEDKNQWEPTWSVWGAFNRAVVFPSQLWHCALPVEGFGALAEPRLVITGFMRKS